MSSAENHSSTEFPVSRVPALLARPGETLGIVGGGQLGRMLALAARSLGYRVHVYAPESDPPAGPVANRVEQAGFHDRDRVARFARGVQAATFEFENIPLQAMQWIEEEGVLRPSSDVLRIAQDRILEKQFLQRHGFPATPARPIRSLDNLVAAVKDLGLPAVLKRSTMGYDGKGQCVLRSAAETGAAWQAMEGRESILEAWVDYEKELSVIIARTTDGQMASFPVFENSHLDHILDLTFAPADITREIGDQAVAIGKDLAAQLGVVGLLTVELFLTSDGRVLVNELAPRTHNSGHLTIDACITSQFEQQVRAVCGLPLGDPGLRGGAAMVNLLGNLWSEASPDWCRALEDPCVKLHLYDKQPPRPGRKMGHMTVQAGTAREAIERVREARSRLR